MVKTEYDAEAVPRRPKSTGAVVPTIGTFRMMQTIVTNRTAMLSIKSTIGKGSKTGEFLQEKTHYLGFRMSDEDEESNSMESDPIPGFGNLQVDDKNANCGAQGKQAIRRTEYVFN